MIAAFDFSFDDDGNVIIPWGLLTVVAPPGSTLSGFTVTSVAPDETKISHALWNRVISITEPLTVTLSELYGLGLADGLADDAIERILGV